MGKILITGGSSGIGKEFLEYFAKEKKEIIIVARNLEKIKKVKKEIKFKYDVNFDYIISDLSKQDDLKKLIKNIEKEDIDVLINNAGFGIDNDFIKTDLNYIEDMLYTHVMATTLLSRTVLKKMIKKNKGIIINLGSIAGYLLNSKSNIIYNSTKRYIIHFSKGLQDEIKQLNKNIKIQALCPGYTKTHFFDKYDLKTSKLYRPDYLYMTAKEVVKISINCLKSKRVVCIPGFKNKIIVFLLKLGVYK
jgi:uncharacterized protein